MRMWRGTFVGLMERLKGYARRDWQWALSIREKLSLSEEAVNLLMAGVVGLMGGTIDVLFYLSIERVQFFMVGHDFPGQNIVQIARELNYPLRILTSAIGGILAGLVLVWGLRLAGKQRSTNILEVVVAGDGGLSFRAGLVRAVSSLRSIGTGASIGGEGGITNLSATAASKWGQLAKWQPFRLRLLVACGAAAGMAAAYNAPITGAIFAAHIVLGNFSMTMFAPLLCSSVVASVVSRSFFGMQRWYEVPEFDFNSIVQLPWFLILGFFAGALAAVFLKALNHSKELFKRVPALWARMGLAGLAVGGIACSFPEVWGNGYVETSAMLQHPLGFWRLVGIFGFKFLATVITVGAGTVGGVITPTLFLGAALGSLFGIALQHGGLAPAHLPIGIFALVGMGSVFAATTRSPLLAIVMVLEISLNYSIMPALMLGCAVSTLVSRRLHENSIYTEPLQLRSLEVESSRMGAATEQTIGDLMRAPVPPVRETATLPEIAERFLSSVNNFLPVVDAEDRLLGMVALQDLKEYLNAGEEFRAIIAYDVMRPVPPCLWPGQRLLDALPTLLASEQRNVPVVNRFGENRLVGSVPRAEALSTLSEAIASRVTTTTSTEIIAKQKLESQPPAPAPK